MRWLFTALAALCVIGSGSAGAADHVTFQLGWLPGGDRAPAYVGAQRGMFAKENIEVKILAGRGGTDTMTKIATGVADMGEVGLDLFLASKAEATIPVTAVMPFFTKVPDVLITIQGNGINTLKDVGGKTVATSPFTSSNLTWPVVLKMNGVDPNSIKLIKADPSTLAGMLAAGQVDAVINWQTSAPAARPAIVMAGKTMHVIEWSRAGYEAYSQTIVASDKSLAERPDVMRRFLKVYREATLLMIADPQGAAENVKAMVPQADIEVLKEQIAAAAPLIMNEVTQRDGMGIFNPDLVKKTWEWAVKANGYVPDKVDPLAVISTKFVGS
jgi:NitT/TauT family transport system substrate-binding protein